MQLFHNPRCAKSRETLLLLKSKGVTVEVIEYLKVPLSVEQISSIIHKLGMKPIELVRKGEKLFKENYKGQTIEDHDWLEILKNNPILIERPILIGEDKAVICRPPEKALDFI